MSSVPVLDRLFGVIESRREELVDLTRELIRFPTVNPPGEAYQPCAEFIGRRLAARGFQIEYVRALGTPEPAHAARFVGKKAVSPATQTP